MRAIRRWAVFAAGALAAALLLVASAGATHTPGDVDGDGWANAVDNCPSVYNDRGSPVQRDQDQDGIGDACDSSFWPSTNGDRGWSFQFYFVDGGQEPVVASTCATVTLTEVLYYPAPYDFTTTQVTGPDHVCESDGQNGYGSFHSNGSAVQSVSRTFEVDCDAGGTLTGSLPDNHATYLPITASSCAQSGMHIYGSAPTPQTLGAPGGVFAVNPSATQAEPVDTATGNYFTSATDLRMSGVGIPFALARSYNSADTTISSIGPGWRTNFDSSLAIAGNGDATVIAPDGQQVVFVHNADGTFQSPPGASTDLVASGGSYVLTTRSQTHYTYSSAGKLTGITDRNGRGLSLTYDLGGKLSAVTDSAGRQVTFTFSNNLLSSVQLPDGRSTQFGYVSGLLSSVTDARGGVVTYGYDSGSRLSTINDQNSHTLVTNVYDSTTGRVSEQIDARGNHVFFAWDPDAQLSTYTDARGNQWRDFYANNVLVRQLDPLGHARGYEHDLDLNLTAITDGRGNTTRMTYDAAGNLKTRTAPSPLNYQESWTYDALNDVKTYTDGRSAMTTYTYDGVGNLTGVTGADPDGAGSLTAPQTTLTRDPVNPDLVTAVLSPRGKTTTYGYDSQGNRTSIQTPLGGKTTIHYDSTGRMDWSVEARGNVQGADPNQYKWTFSYNGFDELTSQSDPLGNTRSFTYYPDGAKQSETDERGNVTSYSYLPSGQLLTITRPDPDGAGSQVAPVTTLGYDAAGNLTGVTDPNNHTTIYGYDAAGRRTSTVTPLGKTWSYTYDAANNLASQVDPIGNSTAASGDGITTYSRDNLNRLTGVTYSDAPTTPNVTFSYDADGNRTVMTDGSGTTTYTYDFLNRLTGVTAGGTSYGYTYDSGGDVTQRTYPDATAFSYTYDDNGRLQTAGNASVGTTTYAYDAAGNRISATLPSGNGYVETQTYDRAGRLTEVKDTKAATILADTVETLDAVGNPLTVSRSGSLPATATYTYDNLDRLSTACFQAACSLPSDPRISWTYDGTGSRLTESRASSTTSYSHDADNRLTSSTLTPGVNPYSRQVRVDGALPYWRFGESSGTTFASSSGSFDGSWIGSPSLGVAGVLNGDSDRAVTLNGTSQFGSSPNTSALGKTTTFSIELWLKRTKNLSLQAVAGKPLTTTTKSQNYAIWIDATNKVRFDVGAGTKSASVTSAAAIDSNWHQVVATFASGAMKLYIDGALSASSTASFTAAVTTTGTFDLGRAGTTNYFGGSLDELAVYGSALSAAQVTDHYTKATSAPPASTATTYVYDDDGRLTNSGTDSFTWNLADRLTGATVLGQSATYAYNGDGERVSTVSGGSTLKESWDTNYVVPQLALERDASNTLVRRYGIGANLNSVTTPSGSFFYLHDPIGSINYLTNATGVTQWTYAYEPYGISSTSTSVSGAPSNPFRYTGQYLDAASNLYDLRARVYDPASGSFLSRDPIGSRSLDSTYSYVNDRPSVLVDPTGLAGITLCAGGESGFFAFVAAKACIVVTAQLSNPLHGFPIHNPEVGTAHSITIGGGMKQGIDVTGSIGISPNANHVADFGGPSYSGGASGEFLIGGDATYQRGPGTCGKMIDEFSLGGSAGLGFAEGAHGEHNQTTIDSSSGGEPDCQGHSAK